MKKLIVNADDFGISESVNRGILRCFREGIVRSTSLMPNLRAFESAVALSRTEPKLSVGIHLNLTTGKPLSQRNEIPHLATNEGQFFPLSRFVPKMLLGKIPLKEVALEFKSQIEKVMASGIRPTHLDTHHHLHFFPSINRVVTKLAEKFKIKRIRGASTTLLKGLYLRPSLFLHKETYAGLMKVSLLSGLRHLSAKKSGDLLISDQLLGIGYVPRGKYQQALLKALSKVHEGVSELVCHPGYVDDELKLYDHWTFMREEELNCMISAETHASVQSGKLELIH